MIAIDAAAESCASVGRAYSSNGTIVFSGPGRSSSGFFLNGPRRLAALPGRRRVNFGKLFVRFRGSKTDAVIVAEVVLPDELMYPCPASDETLVASDGKVNNDGPVEKSIRVDPEDFLRRNLLDFGAIGGGRNSDGSLWGKGREGGNASGERTLVKLLLNLSM
jgi:hypothetical protein